MVFLSDQQLDCRHVVGVTTIGKTAHFIYTEWAVNEWKKYGGVKFNFCPFCSAPVAQILGEVEK